MDIDSLTREVGLDLAMVILWPNVPQEFLNKLDLRQWLQIYLNAPEGSNLRVVCQERMSALRGSFNDWLKIRSNISRKDVFYKTALSKMVEHAQTYDDWTAIHVNVPPKSVLAKKSLKKRIMLATDFDDFMYILPHLPKKSKYRRFVSGKMFETAKEINNWIELYGIFSNNSESQNTCRRKILKIGSGLKDLGLIFWANIYQLGYEQEDRDLQSGALRQIMMRAAEFNQWCKLYNYTNDLGRGEGRGGHRELAQLAAEKITDSISNFQKGLELCEKIDKRQTMFFGDNIKMLVLTRVLNIAATFKEVKSMSRYYPFLEKPIIVKVKMAEYASTIQQWKEVYEVAINWDDEQLKELSMNEIRKLANA